MHWIAPSEKDTDNAALEKRLWDTADQFRANSGLKAQEYSGPILGIIFLRFAEVRFAAQRANLEKASASSRRGSRIDEPAAYHAEGILYLAPAARFDFLLNLPEAKDIGSKVNEAMRDIEKHNPQLAGVLPKTYNLFTSTLLKELLKKVSEIPATVDYDAFGRIYEYFLGQFARTEGQKGGEFYTPSCIVRLLTEVIEPYHGRILDPACGSGGMFVSSARFVSEHKRQAAAGKLPSTSGRGAGGEGLAAEYSGDPSRELSIHGVEKTDETGRLCRLNLAVHGLEGDIRHGGQVNSYYDDPHDATGRFDFVLANPPFNVNAVDKERIKDQVGPNRRFAFGLPRTDNANYLWIQLFHSALNDKGRAGFVMANSASDARASEQEIRQKLIESRSVDVMVAVGPNLFYTVTLPCTLWFFDKSKASSSRREEAQTSGGGGKGQSLVTSAATSGNARADTVLFIDARHIYRQVDRAHREWTPAQIGFLANLVRLYRGEALDFTLGGEEAKAKILEVFATQPSTRPAGHPSPSGRRAGDEGGVAMRGGFQFAGLVERARELRRKQTPAEAVLWEVLRDRRFENLKFRRQHQAGDYLVDFFCHERSLVVEADGDVHDAGYQKKHDKKRDAWLRGQGFTVLRFRNEDIVNDLESVLLKIAAALPSPAGRRAGDEGGCKVAYRDVAGLCRSAALKEIEAQGWSLNPGRYVGVAPGEVVSDEVFKEQLETLNEELETLNAAARELEATIASNVTEILEA